MCVRVCVCERVCKCAYASTCEHISVCVFAFVWGLFIKQTDAEMCDFSNPYIYNINFNQWFFYGFQWKLSDCEDAIFFSECFIVKSDLINTKKVIKWLHCV